MANTADEAIGSIDFPSCCRPRRGRRIAPAIMKTHPPRRESGALRDEAPAEGWGTVIDVLPGRFLPRSRTADGETVGRFRRGRVTSRSASRRAEIKTGRCDATGFCWSALMSAPRGGEAGGLRANCTTKPVQLLDVSAWSALPHGLEDSRNIAGPPRQRDNGCGRSRAHAIDEVGRLARGLHLRALDDHGLGVALSRYVAEYAKTHKIAVDLTLGERDSGKTSARGPRSVCIAFFRRALTNVARHSGGRGGQHPISRVSATALAGRG